MTGNSIKRAGGYLPLLRLDRRAAGAALKWSGLGGSQAGRRSVAGWDEDPVSMAVEAARLVHAPGEVDALIFASTSAPFNERLHAGIVLDALALPRTTATQDVAGSRRCAVSALAAALTGRGETLIVAGERRVGTPGNALQLAWGDGGAAVLVGEGEGGARLLGSACLSYDLVDVYASREHPAPYQAEERFIRDVAAREVLTPTIAQALDRAGVAAGDIAAAVVHEPVSGVYKAVAGKLGLTAPNSLDLLTAAGGDLGAAHVLFGLALALDAAKPGDRLLVAAFGGGCDALVLEVTGPTPGAESARLALAEGQAFDQYVRFLSLTGSLDLDWGPRSEVELKTSATALERYGRDTTGFIGGRDSTGTVQFPKTPVPVAVGATGGLTDERLAESPAKVASFTADRLNYTPDPPFSFGLVQFDNGARLLMEFCDIPGGGLTVGDPLAMRFRIKGLDHRRGFRTYFWKAAPAARPALEA
jgi:hydroxymethylglutaryl-CoA synthase